VAVFCEHGNESSGPIKGSEFLQPLLKGTLRFGVTLLCTQEMFWGDVNFSGNKSNMCRQVILGGK
jgi:hypothetical protein